MIFAVSYGAYLRNANELRFSSVKIKQLRRFGRFYLLRVIKIEIKFLKKKNKKKKISYVSQKSPKRIQLSLIVGIAFGF